MTPNGPISRIVIHHSASPRNTRIEQIHGWHMDRGFTDIGYHYVIEEDGSSHAGRPVFEMGAHAKGANEGTIGICVVGNNLEPGQEWNAAQKDSLREVVAALLTMLGLSKDNVFGHRDVGTTVTDCPGMDREALLELL